MCCSLRVNFTCAQSVVVEGLFHLRVICCSLRVMAGVCVTRTHMIKMTRRRMRYTSVLTSGWMNDGRNDGKCV